VGGGARPARDQDREAIPCRLGRARWAVVIARLLSSAWLNYRGTVPTGDPGVNEASMGPMDEIALRYILLALRLGRHHDEMVSSYTGPPDLAEAVAGEEPIPPAELHAEAIRLADAAAELPTDTPLRQRRAAWLRDQLIALSALARQADGEEIGFSDLAEELFDIQLRPEPEETFATARRMMAGALPGQGSLQSRLLAHEQRAIIPADEVVATLRSLSEVLRRRARTQLWLPPGESVTIEGVKEGDWEAEMRYLGSGRSLVRVNLELPVTIGQAVEMVAHECYPGHHAEAAVKEAVLVAAGHAEVSLRLDLAPETVVREGLATYAREVVMGDAELAVEVERLARQHGLSVAIGAEMMVQRARRLLVPAVGNAALQLHVDGQAPEAVRRYLTDVALLTDARLEAVMSFLGDRTWQSYIFTYIEGRRLVGEWLERGGQTLGFARLLAEQLTPSQLRVAIGAAG
jgi:hypothetical protein